MFALYLSAVTWMRWRPLATAVRWEVGRAETGASKQASKQARCEARRRLKVRQLRSGGIFYQENNQEPPRPALSSL